MGMSQFGFAKHLNIDKDIGPSQVTAFIHMFLDRFLLQGDKDDSVSAWS